MSKKAKIPANKKVAGSIRPGSPKKAKGFGPNSAGKGLGAK